MNRLALILFFAVLMTHYGYDPIATAWPEQALAAQNLFYVMRGLEGVSLFMAVIALIPQDAHAALIVSCWGLVEEGETAVCGLAQGIGNEPVAGPWRGLCDEVTGLPVYALSLAAVLAVVIHWAKKHELGNPP
jgi:hypothetical protein